jgi:broad specificity phosphatase PhoE
MTDQTFYLFRHGLATHSTTGYGDQILTANLLPEAYPTVHRLGVFLTQFTFDRCLTSPIPRCLQTTAVVSEHIQQPFVIDERLTEYWPEIFEPFHARLTDLVDELHHDQASHIAICTHGSVIAGLQHLLRDEPFTETAINDFPEPAGLLIIKTGSILTTTTHTFSTVR